MESVTPTVSRTEAERGRLRWPFGEVSAHLPQSVRRRRAARHRADGPAPHRVVRWKQHITWRLFGASGSCVPDCGSEGVNVFLCPHVVDVRARGQWMSRHVYGRRDVGCQLTA